jgi:hypothetical protein
MDLVSTDREDLQYLYTWAMPTAPAGPRVEGRETAVYRVCLMTPATQRFRQDLNGRRKRCFVSQTLSVSHTLRHYVVDLRCSPSSRLRRHFGLAMRVQIFIAKLAVDALHVAVLYRLAGFDVVELHLFRSHHLLTASSTNSGS